MSVWSANGSKGLAAAGVLAWAGLACATPPADLERVALELAVPVDPVPPWTPVPVRLTVRNLGDAEPARVPDIHPAAGRLAILLKGPGASSFDVLAVPWPELLDGGRRPGGEPHLEIPPGGSATLDVSLDVDWGATLPDERYRLRRSGSYELKLRLTDPVTQRSVETRVARFRVAEPAPDEAALLAMLDDVPRPEMVFGRAPGAGAAESVVAEAWLAAGDGLRADQAKLHFARCALERLRLADGVPAPLDPARAVALVEEVLAAGRVAVPRELLRNVARAHDLAGDAASEARADELFEAAREVRVHGR